MFLLRYLVCSYRVWLEESVYDMARVMVYDLFNRQHIIKVQSKPDPLAFVTLHVDTCTHQDLAFMFPSWSGDYIAQ